MKSIEELRKELREKHCMGKWIKFHYKEDKRHEYRGVCVDEIIKFDGEDYAHRLQKIIWCQDREDKNQEWITINKNKMWVTIRACYYTTKSNKKGLAFGQFCMNLPQKESFELFKEAENKGFFIEMNPEEIGAKIKAFI